MYTRTECWFCCTIQTILFAFEKWRENEKIFLADFRRISGSMLFFRNSIETITRSFDTQTLILYRGANANRGAKVQNEELFLDEFYSFYRPILRPMFCTALNIESYIVASFTGSGV